MADGDGQASQIPWELINPPSISVPLNAPEIVPRGRVTITTNQKSETQIQDPALMMRADYLIPPGIGGRAEVGYDRSNERYAYTSGQLNYLREFRNVENPLEVCLRATDIAAYISSSAALQTFDFSDQQQGLIATARELVDFSDVGRTIFTTAVEADTLVCDYFDLESLGSYDDEQNIINVSTGFLRFSEPAPDGGFSSGISEEDARIRLTIAFEEYAHAHQVLEPAQPQEDSFNIEEYAAIDQQLWALGEEAQVKLLIAREMVAQAAAGNPSLFYSVIETDTSGIAPIARTLMAHVQQGGLEALQDEDILFEGFAAFFNDEDAMDAYHDPDHYEGITHMERVPIELFVETFGYMLPDQEDPNFLEGHLSSMNDVKDLVLRGTGMFAWLHEKAPFINYQANDPYLPVND